MKRKDLGPSKNEWEQRGPYHITILAKNNVGYHNIIKMSSRAFTEGYYVKPRVDHELISQHSEGIIVLSGCLNGEVSQALLRSDYSTALAHAVAMQDIVGKENYFIEIQCHPSVENDKQVRESLVALAKKHSVDVVTFGNHLARAGKLCFAPRFGLCIELLNQRHMAALV